jgi:hypothetical protein
VDGGVVSEDADQKRRLEEIAKQRHQKAVAALEAAGFKDAEGQLFEAARQLRDDPPRPRTPRELVEIRKELRRRDAEAKEESS